MSLLKIYSLTQCSGSHPHGNRNFSTRRTFLRRYFPLPRSSFVMLRWRIGGIITGRIPPSEHHVHGVVRIAEIHRLVMGPVAKTTKVINISFLNTGSGVILLFYVYEQVITCSILVLPSCQSGRLSTKECHRMCTKSSVGGTRDLWPALLVRWQRCPRGIGHIL